MVVVDIKMQDPKTQIKPNVLDFLNVSYLGIFNFTLNSSFITTLCDVTMLKMN